MARYYLDCLTEVGGVRWTLRGDRGTENVNATAMQRFFRMEGTDSVAGEKTFLYGCSVSNQRIEAWWSFLRKNGTDWRINFFENLMEVGLYWDDDPLHVEFLFALHSEFFYYLESMI